MGLLGSRAMGSHCFVDEPQIVDHRKAEKVATTEMCVLPGMVPLRRTQLYLKPSDLTGSSTTHGILGKRERPAHVSELRSGAGEGSCLHTGFTN